MDEDFSKNSVGTCLLIKVNVVVVGLRHGDKGPRKSRTSRLPVEIDWGESGFRGNPMRRNPNVFRSGRDRRKMECVRQREEWGVECTGIPQCIRVQRCMTKTHLNSFHYSVYTYKLGKRNLSSGSRLTYD